MKLVPARSLDRGLLTAFAPGAWPDDPPGKVLSRWWLTSDFAEVIAALDEASGRVAAICVGVPSRWRLPGGEVGRAISICGWYVHPDFAGRGLGRLLVQAFEQDSPFLNTLSISEAAVRGFAKMGWVGPHATKLRLLPLPRLRPRRSGGVRLRSFDASASAMPGGLAEALDAIDAGKPEAQLRRIRAADDWRMRLTARPRRSYRFHVLDAGGEPIGYFAVRPTDEEAGRQYRLTRLHYVTDAVFNSDDLETMSSAFHALAVAVPRSAGALLLCTSSSAIADAATAAGWLDERSPILGKRLAAKAPLYMLGGRFVPFEQADVRLTFADSDVDLNI
jgi:GNAT superfamily N-acetyltransferase